MNASRRRGVSVRTLPPYDEIALSNSRRTARPVTAYQERTSSDLAVLSSRSWVRHEGDQGSRGSDFDRRKALIEHRDPEGSSDSPAIPSWNGRSRHARAST